MSQSRTYVCECVSFSMDACAHMLYMQMCGNFAWKRGRVEVSVNQRPVLSFVYVCACVYVLCQKQEVISHM